MNKNFKIIAIIAIVLVAFILIFSNSKEEVKQESPLKEQPEIVNYFTPDLDKITISASEKVLYTDNPFTTLSYFALDNSNQPVSFEDGDRAFVRILGVTHLYTQNTEIFHPEKSDGSRDNTIFSGKISITEPGKYIIKVCLGKSINLDQTGTMVWPFGCFEDGTSEIVDVYTK